MALTRHLFLIALTFFSGAIQAKNVQNHEILQNVRKSIFKIIASKAPIDPLRPWLQEKTDMSVGSGFYVGKNRILTNAHVVADTRFLMVQQDGDSRPRLASVKAIAHDCDLALLTIEEPWPENQTLALTLGKMPELQSPVVVVGYPIGGEQLSITTGTVARMEMRRYVHSGVHEHLTIQVSSAINPGNSGCPIFQVQGNRIIVMAMAFQAHTGAENTGYGIPALVLDRFLRVTEKGPYEDHPILGVFMQPSQLNHEATARFYGVPPSEGVRVAHVVPWGSGAKYLKKGDILLSTQGQPIGSDGKILFYGERVDFQVHYDLLVSGDIATFDVLRDQKRQTISVPVTATLPHFDASHRYDKAPPYLVRGGLLFTPMTANYLQTFGPQWYQTAPLPLRFLFFYSYTEAEFENHEDFVVLAQRFPHPINEYANSYVNSMVKTVNGKKIKRFSEFVKAMADTTDPWIRIDFLHKGTPLLLSRKEELEVRPQIFTQYGIPAETEGAVR